MIVLYPGDKVHVTLSWTYTGPAFATGVWYVMLQLGHAGLGPFQAVIKTTPVSFSSTQTQFSFDFTISANVPDGTYDVEGDICVDASGTDQSIHDYKDSSPSGDIHVVSIGVFSGLQITYTKV